MSLLKLKYHQVMYRIHFCLFGYRSVRVGKHLLYAAIHKLERETIENSKKR